MKKIRVAVIGGGGTGAALAHDLVLRGFQCTLLERGELTSGTTGRHHGQLHCGARYAVGDARIATECMAENITLRKIAPEAIEFNGGLFLALSAEDEEYCAPFLSACEAAGIPAELLTSRRALMIEPELNPSLRFAVWIPDGTMDAWRLPLHFFATARHNGADIRSFSEVVGISIESGRASGVVVRDIRENQHYTLSADYIVNAAGVWAKEVSTLAGVDLPLRPSPGTMAAVQGRLSERVISRLRPPGDGDTVVPQRTLSIIGTTGGVSKTPEEREIPESDVDFLLSEADALIPAFSGARLHAVWSASRPLAAGGNEENDRLISRDFLCIDHEKDNGIGGFVSIVGGKATVLRAMAERVVDLICEKSGTHIPCSTKEVKLLSHRSFYA